MGSETTLRQLGLDLLVDIDGAGGRGSGYAVGPDLVLTAGHVVGAAATCTLRPPGPGPAATATVVWRGANVDVALLRVGEPHWPGLSTRWGRVSGMLPVDVRAMGHPWAQRQDDGTRGEEVLSGTVVPGSGHRLGRYAVNVTSALPQELPGRRASPWRGMSGGGLTTQDGEHLLGVLVDDPQRFDASRLEAVPVEALLDDPEFAGLVAAGPGDLVPIAVRPRIEPSHYPFEPLDEWSSPFGDENTAQYVPTRQEYARGQIRIREDLLQAVETQLSSGIGLIQGLGTVGKTTLAVFVGLQHIYSGGETYYLDLAGDGTDHPTARFIESMQALAGAATLFIIDNVHLNESVALALYRQWRRSGATGRLLLVGRVASRTIRAQVEGTGVARLESAGVVLTINDEDLLNTYRRLARINGVAESDPQPTPATVAAWRALFGGDRLAFVVAVKLHLEGRHRRRWLAAGCPLTRADAVRYVTDEYLDAYPEARQALIALAAAGAIELGIPDDVVPRGAMSTLMAAGVAHTTVHGRDRYRRYSVPHPGLGELILTAASITSGLAILTELGRLNPFFGFAVANRLGRIGRAADSDHLVRELASDGRLVAGALRELKTALVIISLITRPNLLSYELLDDRLSTADISPTLLDAMQVQLGETTKFLRETRSRLPRYHERLQQALAGTAWAERIAEAVPNDLGNATEFLTFADAALPEVAAEMPRLLADDQQCRRIADAVPNHLGNAIDFLRYASRALPEFTAQLPPLLADPGHCRRIADAIPNNLGNAIEFLQYATRALPDVAAALPRLLADPDRCRQIADAIPNNLGNATEFLHYAAGALTGIAPRLPPLLADPGLCRRIADAVPNNLGNATEFLQYATGNLPEVAAQLPVLLADPGHCRRIADAVPNNLGNATEFLQYATGNLPGVTARLPLLLAEPEHCRHIADAIPNNLGNATEFLQYATRALPDVAAALPRLLADPERCRQIADAVPANLGHASTFLDFALMYEFPGVTELARLLDDDHRCARIARALSDGLGHGAHFLEMTHRKMPPVAARLRTVLSTDDEVIRVADAVQWGLEPMLAFLQFAFAQMPTLARRVAAEVAAPGRAATVAERAGRSSRERWALFRITELTDLHHPDLAVPLWQLLEPPDPAEPEPPAQTPDS